MCPQGNPRSRIPLCAEQTKISIGGKIGMPQKTSVSCIKCASCYLPGKKADQGSKLAADRDICLRIIPLKGPVPSKARHRDQPSTGFILEKFRLVEIKNATPKDQRFSGTHPHATGPWRRTLRSRGPKDRVNWSDNDKTCCAPRLGPLLVCGFHVSLELSLKCWLNDSSLISYLVLRVEVPFS
jgi:hypothetical protein